MLASVRTNSRPPVYFFGDSLGLLGVGEGRQKETIEASLVFEEEEEGETNKVFENKEEEEEFKKNQDIFSVGEDETKNFDEEQNRAIRKRTKSLGEELMEGKREEMRETSNATTGRENLDVCPRCPGRPPSPGLEGTDQPPGQIISTSLLPSPQPLLCLNRSRTVITSFHSRQAEGWQSYRLDYRVPHLVISLPPQVLSSCNIKT